MNYIIAIIAAAFVLWAIFFITVCIRERQPVRIFLPIAVGEQPQFTPYMTAMNELAAEMGLVTAGTFQHIKGGMYKVLASMWLSPTHDILAVVSGGKLGGLRLRKTLLFSLSADRKYYVTSDEFGEADLSGMYRRETLLNSDLNELLSRHRTRLVQDGVVLQRLTHTNILGIYDKIELSRAERLIEQGYACYIDAGLTTWSYTLQGGIRLFFSSFTGQHWKQAKSQQKRANLARPGDPKWIKPKLDTMESFK